MTTYDQPRECPDWVCQPARCICGGPDWKADCDHLDIPNNIILGSE